MRSGEHSPVSAEKKGRAICIVAFSIIAILIAVVKILER